MLACRAPVPAAFYAVAIAKRSPGIRYSPPYNTLDGGQNALEVNRLEAALSPDLSQIHPKKRWHASKSFTSNGSLGLMEIERQG